MILSHTMTRPVSATPRHHAVRVSGVPAAIAVVYPQRRQRPDPAAYAQSSSVTPLASRCIMVPRLP